MKEVLKPYRLSYRMDGGGQICAMGAPKLMRLMKVIEGAELHKSGDDWWISMPSTRINIMIAEAMGEAISASEGYKQARTRLMRAPQDKLNTWLNVAPEIRPVMKPKQHQVEFCAMAYGERGILNGSEQGTGKTLEAIMLAEAWNREHTLIVCPRSLRWQWHGEYYGAIQDPHAPIVPIDEGSSKQKLIAIREFAGIGPMTLVVNYDILANILPALVDWHPNVVIFDESWRCINMDAKVTQAAIGLSDSADKVLLLNGTPFAQDITQLFPQVRMIDTMRGEDFETLDEWRDAYAVVRQVNVGKFSLPKAVDIKDAPALVRRIAPQFWRATKATCLDLPEKLKPERVELELPGALGDLYRVIESAGDTVFNPLSLSGDRVTTIRKQQIVSGICPPIGMEGPPPVKNLGVRKIKGKDTWIMPSPKRDWCLQYARDRIVPHPTFRAIFWCGFTATIEELAEQLAKILGEGSVMAVTGDTNDKEFEAAKAEFNSKSPDGLRVLVAQTKKLAYGHNLPGCDWNILYDHPWRYIERDQLEDRSHRMGRVGPVGYTELVATVGGTKNTKVKKSVDSDILDAFYRREDFTARFAPDTTGLEDIDIV